MVVVRMGGACFARCDCIDICDSDGEARRFVSASPATERHPERHQRRTGREGAAAPVAAKRGDEMPHTRTCAGCGSPRAGRVDRAERSFWKSPSILVEMDMYEVPVYMLRAVYVVPVYGVYMRLRVCVVMVHGEETIIIFRLFSSCIFLPSRC